MDNNGFETFVSPICLPWKSDDPGFSVETGDTTTVTGWGRVTNNNTISKKSYRQYKVASRILQKVELPIVDIAECLKTYPTMNEETQMCAGGEEGRSYISISTIQKIQLIIIIGDK